METSIREESEDGDDSRIKRTRRFHPRCDFSRYMSDAKKTELEQRDSREYRKFRRHFRIPYEILELVQLAKHRKWFSLAAMDVAWRQCLPVVLKDSQSCC